jgi:hypothetical protein
VTSAAGSDPPGGESRARVGPEQSRSKASVTELIEQARQAQPEAFLPGPGDEPIENLTAAQRRRRLILHELLRECALAREIGAEWYQWILDGKPKLTVEEYERVKRTKKHA